LMEDILEATQPYNADNSAIINFSTIPQWLFSPPNVAIPEDPNQVFWSYEQGTELLDQSMQDLGNYYARLVSWYVNGGFTDEYGTKYESGYSYNITHWEVLNEVDSEHGMSPQQYTARYDAIVSAIRSVAPWMKFVGMALAFPQNTAWFEYFLNASNHQPGIPLDYISYHNYVSSNTRTNPADFESFFPQADSFFTLVKQIEQIRKELSPNTKTDLDELGVILPNDNDANPAQFPAVYWNAAAAHYTYDFMNLAQQGIDILGESQMVGYVSQYPSVSMVNYTTGEGTARYWVLSLLLQHFGVDRTQKSFDTSSSDESLIYAQGWTDDNKSDQQKLILINKKSTPQQVTLSLKFEAALVQYVDPSTGFGPHQSYILTTTTMQLLPFGVYLISFLA